MILKKRKKKVSLYIFAVNFSFENGLTLFMFFFLSAKHTGLSWSFRKLSLLGSRQCLLFAFPHSGFYTCIPVRVGRANTSFRSPTYTGFPLLFTNFSALLSFSLSLSFTFPFTTPSLPVFFLQIPNFFISFSLHTHLHLKTLMKLREKHWVMHWEDL